MNTDARMRASRRAALERPDTLTVSGIIRPGNGVEEILLDSPFGRLTLRATERGICEVRLPTDGRKRSHQAAIRGAGSVSSRAGGYLRSLCSELERYFDGQTVRFSVPLDLSAGTPFQRSVWRACVRIPHGQVRSYAELAAMAGSARGARAAGGAMAANPLAIVVPCHRVIRSDGAIGGYGGGATLKKKLLHLEKARRRSTSPWPPLPWALWAAS